MIVSSNGGQQPRWREDGKELFYIAPDRTIMAVEVKGGPAFQSGSPHPLFRAPAINTNNTPFQYDISRDGKRFLVIEPVQGATSSPAVVVLNWQAALKR